MKTAGTSLVVAGVLAALTAAVTTSASASGVDMGKLNRGAQVVPTTPGLNRGARMAAPVRRAKAKPSALVLRLLPAGAAATDDQQPVLRATVDRPLGLQLHISNPGAATEVRLRSLTSGFSISVPALVPVDASSTTVVDIQAQARGCRRGGFIQITAVTGGSAAEELATTAVRAFIKCE